MGIKVDTDGHVMKVNRDNKVSIPSAHCKSLGIETGSFVEFTMDDKGRLFLSPVEVDINVKVTRKSDQPVVSTPNPTPVKKKKRQG